ncbi:hypothetical protein SZN_10613 [Streptomyces zinciresistens K42]|uniref:Carrier domain-containing protein n=1 Tax=Streptomyces zinciresistens K42 TaxID=700597 RepID=G2G9E2_9ACTN|nr:hypothetical protein [Streptomyces zinciresistens]EGX59857.1 hypothetical protein SZN_10613 [Streptomyces zinciresistens K42]
MTDAQHVVSRGEFDAEFAAFVGGLGDGRTMTGVGGDDNLFDAGVLDSFSVIKLIALIENLVGRPIDLEQATIDIFATTDRIYGTFVGPGPANGAGGQN